MKFFSEYFENLDIKDEFKFPYLVGAYSKAIIDSSYFSEISKKNTTFKKWLSNQQLISSNLMKIFNKANQFERKLRLDSFRNSDLSELVTSNFKDNLNIRNSEVSFYFIRGFNDYRKFKEKYPTKQGENNDSEA
ncbi:hypothetical protein CSPARA_0802 [Campylobacter sputorum bv. paraureolyticus LMG 11764]|uniref:hypothetical protein n=1 Tax=Campylobacter sputorum TaxID=206 RepID=UPI000B78041E|nr:hypothetical protein [Campylobacter sputorum]ASM38378.1 hypothetical protein CSPARA_0802 [Campylobacter sputorum bv. paraureolyticus LMG 11764]